MDDTFDVETQMIQTVLTSNPSRLTQFFSEILGCQYTLRGRPDSPETVIYIPRSLRLVLIRLDDPSYFAKQRQLPSFCRPHLHFRLKRLETAYRLAIQRQILPIIDVGADFVYGQWFAIEDQDGRIYSFGEQARVLPRQALNQLQKVHV